MPEDLGSSGTVFLLVGVISQPRAFLVRNPFGTGLSKPSPTLTLLSHRLFGTGVSVVIPGTCL